jgi:DNA-binding CsgD family transcriptional regulator
MSAFPSADALYRFASHLQAALTLDEVEQTYLRCVGEVVFARGHGLYRLHPDTGLPVAVTADVSSDFLEDYEEYGRTDDPVLRFVRERLRPIDSSRVAPRTVWEGSAAHGALGRAGFYHSMEAPLTVAGTPCGTLNFARRRDDPPFTHRDLAAARGAGEQMGLAMERALRFEQTGRRTTMLEDALDRMPQAVVVTDLEANVLFCNRAATRRVDGFRSSLADLARDRIVEAMGELRAENRRITTASVRDRRTHRRLVVKSMRLTDRSEASVTLIYQVQEGGSRRLPMWDVLTPREQEIAQFVSEGLTTRQIAERAFVSENTVKQHLKRIFAKTDVRNRAELMQRIWSAGGPQRPGPDA